MSQRKWKPLDVHDAKDYIKEQFDENGDSAWIEGWITGVTGPTLTIGTDEIRDELFDYLRQLRGV